ncbi:MAG: hypothetical protein JNL94_02380 [Planctomycetes bacterium]|nr:hypothetical protein [Planctomycetota bacterium]
MRFPEIWLKDAGGALRLEEFRYVLVPHLARTLPGAQLPYAIKHLSNVVLEFAAVMTVVKPVAMDGLDAFKRDLRYPRCSFGHSRNELQPLRASPGFWSIDHELHPSWSAPPDR